ncbi:DegV family protein [Brevibacterium sp. Marseille-P9724]|uniref:DegV family protein n=1 Tax=Brevibacterium sp. Marseille-P9724 TaxID=2614125 RepID=UPI0018681F9D|nr:DegV family protein [Brevibacterium sp. Marseille-P9724]
MIGLILDSTVRLSDADREELDRAFAGRVHSVDLTVTVDEAEFQDSQLDPSELCSRMRGGSTVRTSMPAVEDFAAAIREQLDGGADEVIIITLSAEMSGTYRAATAAAAQVAQERGLEADGPVAIRVIDSRTASAGSVGIAHWAAANAHLGLTACADACEKAAAQFSATYFVPETLVYLHRGGRIGGAAALFGRALKIVPVLQVHEGRVEPAARVRTTAKAARRAVDEAAAAVAEMRTREGAENLRVQATVLHPEGTADEGSALFRAILQAARAQWEHVDTAVLSTVVTAHVGPGSAGIEVRLVP